MTEYSPSYSPSGRSRVLPGVSTVDVLSLATSALAAAVAASLPIRQLAEQPADANGGATSSNTSSNGGPQEEQLQKNGSKQNVRTKLDGTVVTDADGAAQRIIVAALRHVSPDVRIVGEESRTEMERSNSKTFEEAARRFLDMDIQGDGSGDDTAEAESNEDGESDVPQPDAEHEIAGIFQMVREEIDGRYREAIGRRIDIPDICGDDDSAGNSCDYRNSNTSNGGSSVFSPRDRMVDSSRVSVLIDPLDGTSCYASGKHEYVTTLVAIVLDNTPIFGVICKPFGHEGEPCILNSGCFAVYGGILLDGVYVAGGAEIERSSVWQRQLRKPPPTGAELELAEISKSRKRRRAIISKSRAGGVVGKCIQALADEELLRSDPAFISGAGVKALHLLVGSSDESLWFFPKAGTSLWDVAAADALLRVVGGRLSDKYGKDINYDKSRQDAENEDGVVACNDAELHARCIQIFQEADWRDDE